MAAPSVRRYHVLEPLARGENGVVYLAQDTILDRRVAYRVLSDEILRDSARRDRFLQGLRVAARLRHPNIAAIFEFGEEDSQPFVASEYIAGRTLAKMHRDVHISFWRTLEWMEDLASALFYAHRNDVVHHDLNPGNLLLDAADTLKLLNLGMCEAGWTREVAGGLPAQANYLSPEQLQGRQADQKSDVFAFGTILYEMVSSQQAFPGETGPALVDRILHSAPDTLADLDPGIALVVDRCLEKDPARRYDSMDELRVALSRLRKKFSISGAPSPSFESRSPDATVVIQPSPAASSDDDQAAALRRRATEVERLVADAERRMCDRRFDEAIRACEVALAIDPHLRPAIELLERARSAIESRVSAEPAAQPRPRMDENVQFTVYRPVAMVPERWYPMLAFAHLAERRAAAAGEPDPIAEVHRQAGKILGDDAADFRHVTQDSSQPIPAEGCLRFVPIVPGVEFNPRERSFLWLEPVQREEFRLRVGRDLTGQTARGVLSVYLGHLLIADVVIAIAVDDRAPEKKTSATETARPYRRIFASYSHRDTAVVRQFEEYSRGFGDRYMRDVVDLRAGEVWTSRLGEMIDSADVFQLFWSWNSMGSPFVRSEWEHALSMNRAHFIRPVYWEQPFPQRGDLPPSALRTLHFAHVGSLVGSVTSRLAPADAAPPPPDEMRARETAERERRRMEMERTGAARAQEAARELAAISHARRQFANGEHQAALQLLEHYQPSSRPEIAEALRELRGAYQEMERHQQVERERMRREAEAEARRRAEWEARRAAEEEEARRRAEMESRRAAEEPRRRAEWEARRAAEEEEASRRAEMESRRAAEPEAKRRAEAEAVRAAEEALREHTVLRRTAPDTDDTPTQTISVPVDVRSPAAAARRGSPLGFVGILAAAAVVLALALSWC